MSQKKKSPDLTGLSSFVLPHGLYTMRAGQLNRKLQSIYRRVRRKSITKDQARVLGAAEINAHRDLLDSDVDRYFSKRGLMPTEPQTSNELDKFTQDKVDEWNAIVDDM